MTIQTALLLLLGILFAGSAGRCWREGKFEGAGVLAFAAALVVGFIAP